MNPVTLAAPVRAAYPHCSHFENVGGDRLYALKALPNQWQRALLAIDRHKRPINASTIATEAPVMAPVVNSSKRNPCPVCGRTKDQDCRLLPNGAVLCHHPRNDKLGTVVTGADGLQWAFTGNSNDERGAIFTLDKPQEKKKAQRLSVIPGGRSKASSATTMPALPAPETFSLARYLPEHRLEGSWWDGEHWYYNGSHRQWRVKEPGKEKRIAAHHKDQQGQWERKGSNACPCWNESLISPELEGFPVFAEGEPCADALCQAGIIGLSLPGHLASSLEHCTAALRRHKQAGLKLVAYLADNDEQGKKKAALMAQSALQAGLPFIGINAGTIWPNLPGGGSVDDLALEPDELIIALDQAFRDELANERSSSKASEAAGFEAGEKENGAISASAVLALYEEVSEKQAALSRLVDDLVAARAAGDSVRDAALMSTTWRLGVPSATTDGLVLQRWAALRGISTDAGNAPVVGRRIGKTASVEGLEQRLPGFLLEHGLHLLIADAGTGKTTMSLAMALLLANGGSGFLDQQEGPTTIGKVLYIGTDGGGGASTCSAIMQLTLLKLINGTMSSFGVKNRAKESRGRLLFTTSSFWRKGLKKATLLLFSLTPSTAFFKVLASARILALLINT
jgi:hypothetical protein